MKKGIFILLLSFVFTAACNNLFAQKSFNVEVTGKGKPILLFPGFGCTSKVWEETVQELSKKHQCHNFTFAGFGNVKPLDSLWLETIKTELEAYIIKNKLKTSTLIGHSLGGTINLWLASSNPKWFNKIILIDALPASAALMIPNYKGEKLNYDNPQSKAILKMTDEEFIQMNKQSAQFMCLNKDKQKLIAEMMNQADRKTYVHGYIDMLNLDLRQEISKIKKPVTILAATNPNLETVKKTYQSQYQNLPTVNILYAENAAHFVMYDRPQWFMKQLLNIIR